ncbi:MAG: hypothetical protein KA254_03715 [Rhodoferax sp.]|nr:hypothetical protein [Rhodoferax sp.]
MLIKSGDDKAELAQLLQDLQRSPMLGSSTLLLCVRGYASKVVDHYSISPEPNRFHSVQSKSAIL